MRLDVYLSSKGFTESRERARRLIANGAVCVDGKPIAKPAFEVEGDPVITLTAEPFVGRGGLKLQAALSLFGINPAGLRALDIGASTGGFTDCLLQHGAAHVTALDVGTGQLHPSLRTDPRVCMIEKYNARDLTPADVGVFDMAVMDVSFISQTLILSRIPSVLREGGVLISLVKPQFEAGRAALGKKGIVDHARDRLRAVQTVLTAACAAGLLLVGLAPSPVLGGDGNEEFLAVFHSVGHPVSDAPLTVEETVLRRKVIKL